MHNQNPQCGDFSYLEHKLQNSFVNDLMNKLCQANYMYYKKSQGSQPTKSFFTLDLIGNVNGNEPVHQNIVQTGLLNAWSKEYSGNLKTLKHFIKLFKTNFMLKQKDSLI